MDLGVEDKEGELRMMQEMQRAWICFAYGEDDEVYGVSAVKVFGPDGKVG